MLIEQFIVVQHYRRHGGAN